MQDKNVIKILNVIVIKVNIVNGILLNQNMNVYQVKQNVLNVKLGVNIVNKWMMMVLIIFVLIKNKKILYLLIIHVHQLVLKMKFVLTVNVTLKEYHVAFMMQLKKLLYFVVKMKYVYQINVLRIVNHLVSKKKHVWLMKVNQFKVQQHV